MEPSPATLDVTIHNQAANVTSRPAKKTVDYDDQTITIRGMEYTLDEETGSILYVFHWPRVVPIPEFKPDAEYHTINVYGIQTQPRRTLCYGSSYNYSGVPHKLEKITPPAIQDLMLFTEAIYEDILEDEEYSPMCLANRYTSGYHCIGKHSDSEKGQFCSVKDIICWVHYEGPGRRRLVLRNKATNGVVFDVSMGNCIYIMSGERFQSTLTHEIPRDFPTLFEKTLLPLVPEDVDEKLAAADWLVEHRDEVSAQLHGKHVNQFKLWCTERCSYTVRFFTASGK